MRKEQVKHLLIDNLNMTFDTRHPRPNPNPKPKEVPKQKVQLGLGWTLKSQGPTQHPTPNFERA